MTAAEKKKKKGTELVREKGRSLGGYYCNLLEEFQVTFWKVIREELGSGAGGGGGVLPEVQKKKRITSFSMDFGLEKKNVKRQQHLLQWIHRNRQNVCAGKQY